MTQRRTLIKNVGIGLTTLGTIGTASGKKANSNSHIDIDTEVLQAYSEDGQDGLRDVMEDYNYNYRVSTTEKTFETDDMDDNSGITTQARHKKPNSDLSINAFSDPAGDDRIRVQVIVNLRGVSSPSGHGTWAEDAISITYNGNDWTNVGESSLRINPSDAGSIELFPESLKDGGLGAVVDLDKIYTGSGTHILLAQSLSNLRGIPATVYGSYIHAWTMNPTQVNIESISGGAGPANVEFSGWFDGDSWPITHDEATDGLI